MNTTDLFLDKYRELEVAVRQVYKLDKYESAISFLKKQKSFEKHSADIDYISDIRNLLSHKDVTKLLQMRVWKCGNPYLQRREDLQCELHAFQ